MDVDGAGAGAVQVPQQPIERRNLDEVNLVDDDELQAALSRQRREAGRKFARDRKARLASVPAVKEEDEGADGMEVDLDRDLANGGSSAAGGEGGLVLDDISEFVRNITYDPLEEARKKRERADRYALEMTGKKEDSKPLTVKKEEDEEGRTGLLEMEVKQEEDEELEEGEAVDEDTEMAANGIESDRPRRSRSRSVSRMSASVEDVKPKVEKSGSAEPFDPFLSGTAGEKFHSGGMAATLAILKTSGAIKPLTPEELERDRQIRQTEAQLSEQRKFEVQLAEDRAQAKLQGSKKSQTEREAENRERDRLMALKQEERMRSYNPVVDIKYTDEFGREVGPKEAWK
jgi:U4/U6.U5 tri-snRNP-associated protein 1